MPKTLLLRGIAVPTEARMLPGCTLFFFDVDDLHLGLEPFIDHFG